MNKDNKYDVAIDYAINDILTKDDPKCEDTKRKYNRGEYDYKGGDDKVRKAGCDMWKFETWLADCPVTIESREDCAYGWIEMHFTLDDERNED